MIRGAIAFGLVLNIDGKMFPSRDIIVTTTLSLVLLTTIVLGGILGVVQVCLFGNSDTAEVDDFVKADAHPNAAAADFSHPN